MIEFLHPLSRAWRAWRGTRRARLEALAAAPFPVRWHQALWAKERALPAAPGRPSPGLRAATTGLHRRQAHNRRRDGGDRGTAPAGRGVGRLADQRVARRDQVSEVLLYPSDFDHGYRFGGSEIAGQAHQWGVVILSVPRVRRGFDQPAEGHHVGFHEFAPAGSVARQLRRGAVVPGHAGHRAVAGDCGARTGASAPGRFGDRSLRALQPGRVPADRGRGVLPDACGRGPAASGALRFSRRVLQPGSRGVGRASIAARISPARRRHRPWSRRS